MTEIKQSTSYVGICQAVDNPNALLCPRLSMLPKKAEALTSSSSMSSLLSCMLSHVGASSPLLVLHVYISEVF